MRVRYAECDRMGFVHHSVYALYFEEARTEILRNIGLNYKTMEDEGIIMPVRSMSFLFKKAAHYDDLLTITVSIPESPLLRCKFHYETRNQHGELLNTAEMELFFADRDTLRPKRLSEKYLLAFKNSEK